MITIGAWWSIKNKRLDASGLSVIKNFEDLSLVVYKDVAGLDTIGYGHLIKSGENFNTITKGYAEQLLLADVQPFENVVNNYVKVPLTQNMFNSLVSLTYNIGINGFKNSTVLKQLNNGDYISAANSISMWNKATIDGKKVFVQGLANRRENEQQIFFS